MAIVSKFERDDREFRSRHPTKVTARYIIDMADGKKVIQINTYGSSTRQIPDKLSQTLQLTQESARELWTILGKEFGFR